MDPFILRSMERIIAVIIGGLAIYFGYRLFLSIPDQRSDGRAEISLSKDRRLLVSRVGPGTFFALFGTAVLVASYAFPVKIGNNSGLSTQDVARQLVPDETGPLPPRPINFDELSQSLAFLKDLEARQLAAASEADRDQVNRRFRAVKLALMGRAWQSEWGDPTEFEIWLNETDRPRRPEFERALAIMEGSG
ncbi:hypothetical protein [Mesorhizobium sp. CN2-181]|uniref:hypothetical protein n=1 Tax=Mesorhizobium yinganensis TaxID=3157707 RepID=UPI0032B8445B